MDLKLLSALALIAAVGCNNSGATGTQPNEPGTSPANVAADDTAKNKRDRSSAAVTPGDQNENETDRTITQQIRQGVVASDALSMSAKNVKIVTANGIVTLRGPVETQTEKSQITQLVKKVEGVKQVDNQLEIAAK